MYTEKDLQQLKETELKRWFEQEKSMQQEYAKFLGIHQGRMSIYDEQINILNPSKSTREVNNNNES